METRTHGKFVASDSYRTYALMKEEEAAQAAAAREVELEEYMGVNPGTDEEEEYETDEEDEVEVDERFIKFEFQPSEYVDLIFFCYDYTGRMVQK